MANTSDADKFDRLLAALPGVSAAFTDPQVQLKAIEALSTALGNDAVTAPEPAPAPASPARTDETTLLSEGEQVGSQPARKASAKKAAGAKSSGSKKDWTITRGLNFAPAGQVSLKDFVEQKAPRSQNDKNVVAVYYLGKIMTHAPVTVGDVLAVYQAMSWSKPGNPTNSLQVTASTKGWIDTKDMDAITVVWAGTSYVEDEMPLKKGKA